MKKCFSFSLIILMIIVCITLIPSVKAADSMTKTVISSGTLQEGVTYEKFSSVLSHEGSVKNEVISYVKKAADASHVKAVVWGIRDSGFKLAAIDDIARDYEKKHPDQEVLAIINGDYFYTTDGSPVNREVIDGNVNKNSNYATSDRAYVSVAINDDSNKLTNVNTLTYTDNYTMELYDADGEKLLKEVVVSLNQEPNNVYKTAIYFNASSSLNATDEIKIYDIFSSTMNISNPDNYIFGGFALGEASSTGNSTNVLRIASCDQEVINMLNSGARLKISKDFVIGSNNVIGAGSQPLVNGKVLPTYADILDNPDHERVGTTPRSSIGVTADGDLIICAIDGRQSSNGMYGVTIREEAYIMQQLGCVDCFNLDGGGSTQLYIKDNGSFKKLNNPSESKRYITNAILFVQQKVGAKVEESKIGNDTIYNVTPLVKEGIEVLETKFYWNGFEINGINNSFRFRQLEDQITTISVEVTYKEDGQTKTAVALNKKLIPDNFDYTCQEEVNKLELHQLIFNGYGLDESLYEATSVNEFKNALSSAVVIQDKIQATNEEVSNAVTALKNAFDNLKTTKDLAFIALEEKLTEAKAINRNDYTMETSINLSKAIGIANSVLGKDDPTEDEINDALDGLTKAIEGLVLNKVEEKNCTSFDLIQMFMMLSLVFLSLFIIRKKQI